MDYKKLKIMRFC